MLINNASDAGTAHVIGENEAGGARIARFLVAGGAPPPCPCGAIPGVSSSDARLAGYRAALVGAGHPAPEVVAGQFDFDVAFAAVQVLLRAPTPPDAVFCANDHTALAVVNAACAMGPMPGHDVSIVGFDDVGIGRWPNLALTSYSPPAPAMAEAVVDLRKALMDGNPGLVDGPPAVSSKCPAHSAAKFMPA